MVFRKLLQLDALDALYYFLSHASRTCCGASNFTICTVRRLLIQRLKHAFMVINCFGSGIGGDHACRPSRMLFAVVCLHAPRVLVNETSRMDISLLPLNKTCRRPHGDTFRFSKKKMKNIGYFSGSKTFKTVPNRPELNYLCGPRRSTARPARGTTTYLRHRKYGPSRPVNPYR